MTSAKLLLAAGSVAASLAGIGPAVTHGASGAADPMMLSAAGSKTTLTVPAGATTIVGRTTGSPALAERTRVTVTRASDGATLFTGSLATFRSLPVQAGTALVVQVQKPTGFAGLRASAQLRWA